jgi:hypothetical protein
MLESDDKLRKHCDVGGTIRCMRARRKKERRTDNYCRCALSATPNSFDSNEANVAAAPGKQIPPCQSANKPLTTTFDCAPLFDLYHYYHCHYLLMGVGSRFGRSVVCWLVGVDRRVPPENTHPASDTHTPADRIKIRKQIDQAAHTSLSLSLAPANRSYCVSVRPWKTQLREENIDLMYFFASECVCAVVLAEVSIIEALTSSTDTARTGYRRFIPRITTSKIVIFLHPAF